MRFLFQIAAGVAVLALGTKVWAGDAAKVEVKTAVQTLSSGYHLEYDALLKNDFSIHFRDREIIGPIMRLYVSGSRADFVDVASEQIASIESVAVPDAPKSLLAPAAVPELVNSASDKHQIDADFINSVIRAESDFNPRAVSPKGARGLMQLMPETASKLGVKDSFDPAANIDGGTRYLRELLVRYNGDALKALAAYNAGPHRVDQYHGVPPYPETRVYVARVVRDFNRKKVAKAKTSPKATSEGGKLNKAQEPARLSPAS